MNSDRDTLQVEAGCVFEGAVLGGGGTLDLASGVGTVSGMTGGDVIVSNSMPTTTFNNFGTIEIAKAARFTLTGAGAIASGGTAALIDNGLFSVAGALVVAGTVKGTGTLGLASDARVELDNAAPKALSLAFKGADATLALKDPSAFAATISGFAPTDTIDLLKIAATSAVLGAGDTLVITNGSTAVSTLQLTGTYTGDTFTTKSDRNGGTSITVSAGATVAPAWAAHQFIAAAASLGVVGGTARVTTVAHYDAWRPMLSAPRLNLA